VTASFGLAIPSHILGLFASSRRLNVHPSLLPKLRGAAPIQRALTQGMEGTGVSILEMQDIAYGFDTGPVWAQRRLVRCPSSPGGMHV
jgi:methionyl-tRNA formyltransferase